MTNAEPTPQACFEDLMTLGVVLNNTGNHQEALSVRRQAFALADSTWPESIESGRAARDIGHSYDRLGNTTDAELWLTAAFGMHDKARRAGMPGAEREYRASAGSVGLMALRKTITSELNGRGVERSTATTAIVRLWEAGSGPHDDQYTINFLARSAMAQVLYQDRSVGRKMAKQAMRMGLRSEAPQNPTSTDNFSRWERFKAKGVAVTRGAGVLAASLLGPEFTDFSSPPQSRRRSLALQIAARII